MDNPVKNFFSSFNFLKGGDGDNAVGIDIGSSAIKVVEIKKRKGKAVLETYGAIALGSYADTDIGRITNLPLEKVVEALKEVLKQSGVTTTSSAFSIPVQSSLVFTISLPTQVKESEISSIVPTEARKYIPLPITEVSLDYFILPQKESSFEEVNNPDLPPVLPEKTEVLVVAIQNDAVSKYRSIVSQCSLEAGFFEIEIFSSIRANFEHELSLVLLMDFGASSTKLSLVEFGMVKNHHTINRGGADISSSISKSLDISFPKAEEMKKEFGLFENPAEKRLADIIKIHIDYIFSETDNVLLGYEKKYNRTISKVIFTGGGALLKGLKEVASNNFRAEIEIGHPFSKVGAPEFLGKVLETTGPEFAVALGLALRKLQ
ncbi:MAG: Type IV pilus assembly protein PilM [Candidatus Nomurabacteria bacterium GW2011_GWB1_35_20]|uniref:Type IV pilus assembly protein PilM n=4 Tax=Candidatus Nomuraibacteriota TaxID=1752729 RepID=A0A0G0H451_9BACT|nr:MAG: Type IV pilus assembly protein PilM [Candidatus Nomurabacteria bacterium GW2011_GWB1_35_20]KKP76595.1 MAG: Type IV pilus assembly protein PilM [Parcubacteria group bacterium GW2011_GWC1_35_21]KKP98667.1 MAG: Type IV pilus assembly protein PilM [Candidatus Nomurabacteria bacterium GW2011_GWA1_36_15]